MANGIKIGDLNISYFKVGGSDCSIYLGTTLVYPTSPSQTPCFAVVDDISDYTDTDFVDVYAKLTDKWYKLNNLNEYEEYGVYGEGRNITYYEGKLTIDGDYEYQYSGGSWVNLGEVSGSTATLPDVPFTVNYNAKNYDSTTKTFAKTSGQLADRDVTISQGTPTPHDTYVTVASGTMGVISGNATYFNRTNSAPELTIISKQRTDGSYCHLFANRGSSNYNWMYRAYSNKLTLHGTSEQGSIAVTTQPVIEGVRVDSNRLATYNNYTNNTTSTQSNFGYGSTNGNVALFAGYAVTGKTEWFVGDFYWIYMSQTKLTDAQVQQVIDYNEGGGGQPEYPEYYEDKQDPPTEVTFATMEEALAYACPYVGLFAMIGGNLYIFNDQYQWEELSFNITGVTKSSSAFTLMINGDEQNANVYRDNGDGTYDWGLYYPSPITNTAQMASGNTALQTFDWYNADTSNLTSIGNYAFGHCTSLSSVTIPSSVTSIDGYAFTNCTSLSSVEIPSGVTSIGTYAFTRCTDLTSITIPSGVTSIGTYAFYSCSSLRSISIPSGVTSIGRSTFYGCNSLTNITIPNGVTLIDGHAFYQCSSLSSVTIPNSVTTIGERVFYQCTRLRSISIPNGVTSIGGYTFYSCTSLSSVTIGSGVTSIGDYAFHSCYNLTSITIPNSVTSINQRAFVACRSLSSVTIPSGVTSIGQLCFSDCYNLTSVIVNATTPPTLGASAFNNTNDCPIYVPCESVNAYRTASNWSTYASRIIGFESCTTYDWEVVQDAYVCYQGDKYEKLKKIRSFDNGETWEDVTPEVYDRGELIESESEDCTRIPDGYTELDYVTVPYATPSALFTVPIDFQSNYKYTYDFTPINFWSTSYYAFLLGNGDTSYSSVWNPTFAIGKLDNGWGAISRRWTNCFHNYTFNSRSGGNVVDKIVVYDGARCTFEFHLKDYITNNGAVLNISQVGYSPTSMTSTTLESASYTVTYGTKQVGMFTAYPIGQQYSNKTPNMKFHEFKVETENGVAVNDYVPCSRDSDGKVGILDIVSREFYFPTGFTLTAGNPIN